MKMSDEQQLGWTSQDFFKYAMSTDFVREDVNKVILDNLIRPIAVVDEMLKTLKASKLLSQKDIDEIHG